MTSSWRLESKRKKELQIPRLTDLPRPGWAITHPVQCPSISYAPDSSIVFWHQTGCVLLGNCPQPSNSLQLSLVTEAWTTYKWKGSRVRQEVTQNQFDQHADNQQAWTKKHPPNHEIMSIIWTAQIKSKRQISKCLQSLLTCLLFWVTKYFLLIRLENRLFLWAEFRSELQLDFLKKSTAQPYAPPSQIITGILKVSKSQKHFFLKLHCPKNELNILQKWNWNRGCR